MTNTLYVKGWGQYVYDSANSQMAGFIYYQAPDNYNFTTPTPAIVIHFGSTDPSALPYPTFPTLDDAITYFGAASCATLISTINTGIGTTYYTAYELERVESPIHAAFSSLATVASTGNYSDLIGLPLLFSGAYSDLTGKPTFATVATSGSYNDLSNKPSIPTINTPSFSNPSRSLNTVFQVSTTQAAHVSYSVDISCSMSLTSGQSGTAFLEYADDNGFTTNVKVVSRGTNSNSGALTLGLALTQIGGAPLVGMIPANKYVRIRTANNTGTPTFTLQNAQEVLV